MNLQSTTNPEMDLKLVEACERRILNAWPAIETFVIGDWVVRFANGYSGRANSASALSTQASLDAETLALIEGLFVQANLAPCFRLTPLAAGPVAALLDAHGYRLRDASIGMVSDIVGMVAPISVNPEFPVPAKLQFRSDAIAKPDWVRGVSARQSGSKKDADAALMAIVSRVRMPANFMTLALDGKPIGFGMSVIERGMAEIGSIVIDENQRGKGMGTVLVSSLLHWASRSGAKQAYLQVEQGNTSAIQLYHKLGFHEVYRYATMVKPG